MSEMNSKGKLFVISAPSGAGKTSLVKALLERHSSLSVAISHTTRKRRNSEVDGVNYHFVSEDEFKRMIDEQAFVESALVFGNYYGSSKEEIDRQLGQGLDLILEIDWQGAEQIREQRPDCISIFILPPSLPALRQRLQGRGLDDEETIDRRTKEAINELSHYQEFDFLVVNDEFDEALEDLTEIIRSQPESLGTGTQSQRLKPLLDELLK